MLATAEVAPGLGALAARVGLALLVVCLLAAALLWLLRRRGGAGGGGLRVLARLTLEPRRRLFVVDAGGRFLLVGVGEGPMTLLCELSADEARRIEAEPGAAAGLALPGPGLGRAVGRAIGRALGG